MPALGVQHLGARPHGARRQLRLLTHPGHAPPAHAHAGARAGRERLFGGLPVRTLDGEHLGGVADDQLQRFHGSAPPPHARRWARSNWPLRSVFTRPEPPDSSSWSAWPRGNCIASDAAVVQSWRAVRRARRPRAGPGRAPAPRTPASRERSRRQADVSAPTMVPGPPRVLRPKSVAAAHHDRGRDPERLRAVPAREARVEAIARERDRVIDLALRAEMERELLVDRFRQGQVVGQRPLLGREGRAIAGEVLGVGAVARGARSRQARTGPQPRLDEGGLRVARPQPHHHGAQGGGRAAGQPGQRHEHYAPAPQSRQTCLHAGPHTVTPGIFTPRCCATSTASG